MADVRSLTPNIRKRSASQDLDPEDEYAKRRLKNNEAVNRYGVKLEPIPIFCLLLAKFIHFKDRRAHITIKRLFQINCQNYLGNFSQLKRSESFQKITCKGIIESVILDVILVNL